MTAVDREALKREYLRCFGVRTTNTVALQEAVQNLIRQGVSRKTLVEWAVRAGFAKTSVSSLLSRVFCALGLRERQAGAGRKVSSEALELLAYANGGYREKCLKVLRGGLRAGKKQLAVEISHRWKTSLLQPTIRTSPDFSNENTTST